MINKENHRVMQPFSNRVSFSWRSPRGLTGSVMALVLAVGVGASPVQAASLEVPNGSFESPTPPPGFPASPVVDVWQKSAQPAWFDTNATGGIMWDQLSGVFPNTPVGSPDHIVNLDGDQAAYLFNLPEVALSQELAGTYQVGLSYELTVGVLGAGAISEGSGFALSLYYVDGTDSRVNLATTPIAYSVAGFPDATSLIDFTVQLSPVQADDPWAGQPIGIELLSTSGVGDGYWDLDHVRLEAVPEPGAMAMLAAGLASSLVVYRGTRRRPLSSGDRDS